MEFLFKASKNKTQILLMISFATYFEDTSVDSDLRKVKDYG